MAYVAWSVVFGEQPTAGKWNILGTNDASFHDGTGIDDDAIITRHIADGDVTAAKLTTPPSRYVAIDPILVLNNFNPLNTNWTDIDVTAAVSANAYAVMINIVASAAVGSNFTVSIRPNGSSNTTVATQALYTMGAGQYNAGHFAVKLDSNKIFEWKVSDAAVSDFYIGVVGYWELVA